MILRQELHRSVLGVSMRSSACSAAVKLPRRRQCMQSRAGISRPQEILLSTGAVTAGIPVEPLFGGFVLGAFLPGNHDF